MKQSGESRRTSQYNKKCITVCVQGHGEIAFNNGVIDYIKDSVRNNATILTVASGIGRKGLMRAECPTMTMRGIKREGVSDVLLCGQALDVMAMEYFHSVYNDLSKKPNMTGCKLAKDCIKIITENIPLVYANSNIPYFHKYNLERDTTTHPTDAFKLTKPHYNKVFYMYPNTHEYCNEETSDCEGGRCILLRERQRRCPEYGITVLQSSVPSDDEYTLAGLPMVNDINIEKENRLAINLNQMEGHEPLKIRSDDDEPVIYEEENYFDEDGNVKPQKKSCYMYWKTKLTHYKIHEIRVIQNHITYQQKKKANYTNDTEMSVEEKQQLLLQLDKKIQKLKDEMARLERIWRERFRKYDMMTNQIDRYTPSSSLSPSKEALLPEVTLDELIDIFINGMKYDHIYIIDPTCNSYNLEKSRSIKLLKMIANNYVERTRTKTDRPSFLPTEYVKRFRNHPSEGTNNPREHRVDIKRTKSIGGKRKMNVTKKRMKHRKSHKK